MDKVSSREEFVQFLQNYIQSDTFQEATDAVAAGWEKLFMRYKRRMVLEKAGRLPEILRDSLGGNEYYQGYRYSPNNGGRPIYCHNAKENCALRENAVRNAAWLGTAEGELVDQEWINRWSQLQGSMAIV
jgi:hypothetical protein